MQHLLYDHLISAILRMLHTLNLSLTTDQQEGSGQAKGAEVKERKTKEQKSQVEEKDTLDTSAIVAQSDLVNSCKGMSVMALVPNGSCCIL